MANEKRLIDANALKMALCTKEGAEALGHSTVKLARVSAIVDAQPAVDAVEVVHARWEYIPIIDGLGRYRCERCFHYVDAGTDRNYCPNCGAKMDGDGNV